MPLSAQPSISRILIQNECEIHTEETALFRVFLISVKTISVVSGL